MSIIKVRGRSRTTSTSKIKKTMAIRKNRRENGRRADPLGSNPHSKGELFSRSANAGEARKEDKSIIRVAIDTTIITVRYINKIAELTGSELVNWKSTVL